MLAVGAGCIFQEISMFDAKELLTALLGGQGGPAGGLGGVLSNAMTQAQSGIAAAAESDLGKRVGGALSQGANMASQAATQAGSALSGALSQAEGQLAGTEAGAALDRAKAVAQQNPMATGAVLGGLAALLLGTQGGRTVAGDAAKLGGLAVLGGLAYKAYRNHQEGKPLTAGIPGLDQLGAPQGSGFDAADHSHDSALLMVRAMIAGAAADGIVDPQERQRILGKMQEAGLGADAAAFVDRELAHPASASEIATRTGSSKELAAQVYAAAVYGAHAGSRPEQAFLADLAKALALDPGLAAHIGAAMGQGG
jgi:uncharacterized membrane protein YebE (DUF533 family)